MSEASREFIFKITTAPLWAEAQRTGILPPSPIDRVDGYIHFSTAAQTSETLSLHFKGQVDLELLRVPVAALGDALKWEPSRGGKLFPHLYADLPISLVDAHVTVAVSEDGTCTIPDNFL